MLIHTLSSPPDLLGLHLSDRQFFPYLLQGAADQGWDILMAAPRAHRVYSSQEAEVFWQDLRELPRQDVDQPVGDFPFSGGWFVYLGYELLHALEPTVASWPEHSFPLAVLTRIPAAILLNRQTGMAWVVAENDAEPAWQAVLEHVRHAPQSETLIQPYGVQQLEEEDPDRFIHGVQRIRDYIREGDVFQVNLSRAWQASLHPTARAADLYHQLRQVNPGPFNALADFGCGQIISSSPERLLSLRQGKVSTRPIAGTHPRSRDAAEDLVLKARLIASLKERAEHIMLIDLERNDLGRICVPGSVRVEELMSVESYAFVHHIESVVSGMLREGMSSGDAIAALFPGGTITGCPKVRTMQIIRELESGPRGAYTGSLGYINLDGSLDLNILIRSFMQSEGRLQFRAGAGIVTDSVPDKELAETRAKAKGLLRALGGAHVAD